MRFYNHYEAIIFKKKDMQNDVLKKQSFLLASDVIDICENLQSFGHKIIANQLLKSGTSVGANIRESVYAESIADFIHKLSIARKEAAETLYWLDLISYKHIFSVKLEVYERLNHIQKIITILIKSSRNKLKKT